MFNLMLEQLVSKVGQCISQDFPEKQTRKGIYTHTHTCILRDLVQGKGLCDFGDRRVQKSIV